jgi:diguanylate cyclase (GGDEF)-like protein/PAS domain S-box-containing protein
MFSSLSDYIDHLLEAICVVDQGGRYLYLSSGFTRILGYESQELLGRAMIELVHPDDRERTLSAARDIMAGDAKVDFENRYLHKNGRVVHILWSAQWHPKDKVRIAVARDITKHKEQVQILQALAFYDQLTQLPNRALFSDRLQRALVRAKREQTSLALLFIDLDNLKRINDSAGHSAGDELLLMAARHMSDCVRASDTVSRFGGDEFVVLLDGIDTDHKALAIARHILHHLTHPSANKSGSLAIHASIGIAIYPQDGQDEASLLTAADAAMYQAKGLGGDRIQLASARQSGQQIMMNSSQEVGSEG